MAGLTFPDRVIDLYDYRQSEEPDDASPPPRILHVLGHTARLNVAVFISFDDDGALTFQAITAGREGDGALASHWSTSGKEDITWGLGGVIVQFGGRGDLRVAIPFDDTGERLPAMVNGEFVQPSESIAVTPAIPVVPVPHA